MRDRQRARESERERASDLSISCREFAAGWWRDVRPLLEPAGSHWPPKKACRSAHQHLPFISLSPSSAQAALERSRLAVAHSSFRRPRVPV